MPNSALVHVNVTFRNTEATDALRDYSSDKITTLLQKYLHKNTEVYVVLKVEKTRQIAEVHFNCEGEDFSCKEESDDMYKSIDASVDSLSSQLRKHKERLTNHHKESVRA
jgi:putative sigma-54 modulation protein